ncbi:MAG: hypothetical protein Q9191_006099 [Dirinaria sp. TL-2023a]
MSTNLLDAHGRRYNEWDTMSKMYESTVGRFTGPMVQELVQWADSILPLSASGTKALDNGCGTGSLSGVLKRDYPDVALLATDCSSGMIDKVRKRAAEEGWRAFEARVQDARDLNTISDESITHVFSSFMICLAPDPDVIAKEMFRVLDAGIIGLAVWGEPNFSFWHRPWTEACLELDPRYQNHKFMHEEWTHPEMVKKGLIAANFKDVEIRTKEELWPWENVDAAMHYFFDGHNPMNEELHRWWQDLGRSLDEVKPVFGRKLREAFGREDGSLEGPLFICLAIARK